MRRRSSEWAIFLDRDGVINEPVYDDRTARYDSPLSPEQVKLVPRAPEALRMFAELGVPLVVVSNQPSAAKGMVDLETLHAVHRTVEDQLASAGVHVDRFLYCFHHPRGTHPELGQTCGCRKPAPGMILAAVKELEHCDLGRSWMVGDSDVDVEAGLRAGCRTILIEDPRTAHRRTGTVRPEARVGTVRDAALLLRDAAGH